MHLLSGSVAPAWVRLASLQNHGIEAEQLGQVRRFADAFGHFRKFISKTAHPDLIKDLAEAEDIRLGAARTFGWDIPGGADVAAAFINFGNQANVGEFWHTVHENDV